MRRDGTATPQEAAARVPWGKGGEPRSFSSLPTGWRKQVAEWLGHADPAFTLRTHVHLIDERMAGAEFFDEAVGGQATVGSER